MSDDKTTIKATPNVFEHALQTWVEIDLPSLQKKLDEQGLEIKEDQKSSVLSRKNLATKTKEFKKLEDAEKLDQVKSLLKLYQNEIDSLTNKGKNVENCFFGVYRLIAEAPDPRPLLEMSLDSVIESKDAANIRAEVSRLEEELAKKADYDQLKQRLLSNEQKSAELLSNRIKAKENEFKAISDEKENNWKEKERRFENQLLTAQKQIEELRAFKEVSELQLDNQNRNTNSQEASASVLAELDMVRRDSESAKKRIFELEKRNEDLRREVSKSKTDNDAEVVRNECDKKVQEVESENVLLVANLDHVRKQLTEASKSYETKIESINRENSQMIQEIKNLKSKLSNTSDYEEIKHELHLLRQIEFGHDDEDGENGQGEGVKLDSIVIERNKAMTQELAQYRSQHHDLVTRIDNLQKQVDTSEKTIGSLKQLNEKLENDLADLQEANGQNRFNDNASLISGMSRFTRPSHMRSGSIISGMTGDKGVNGSDDSSILPIITKQRDRFREKNNELEDELRKSQNKVNDLKRQVSALKQDNEELYERGRYLASFQTPGTKNITTTASGRKFLNPKPNVDLERNDVEYQRNYEKKLHPMEQFRIREQERINSKLSPLERLFISLTRAVLATRLTRMIFFAYCLGLHIIVMFITIYAMNIHTSLIPEVGLNSSTGGVTTNKIGSPQIGENDALI
ncbi:hypothetical protein CANMA_004896 [Candida margitis]|uniref:uncharacterized protein n=1 Tax=Candida margitis TaxID=1775924 RepID=UPI002227B668|nr:uncharacterized protein CANMA_004896 [Candida margitis]KAI5954057.1 hypothetical protein CANMA_004896 [Candida margitis]